MGIWQRWATVSIANGSNTFTGSLTMFGVYTRPGDGISFDGGSKWYEVEALDDTTPNTVGRIVGTFEETSVVNGPVIIDNRSYRHQVPSDIIETLRKALGSATFVRLTTGTPSDAIGAEGSISLDVAAQSLYYKTGGSWLGPIALGLLDGDHGDITVSDSGNTLTIGANKVTTGKIADSNVTAVKIADSNVTTAKIADANVTTPKIADSNVTTPKIADANVTTVKIADDNVTNAKLANMAAGTLKANLTGGAADPTDSTLAAVKSAMAITGGDVANTPAGGIAATTAQAAINELDTEKLDKVGGTISGNLTITGDLIVNGTNVSLNSTNSELVDAIVAYAKNNSSAAAPYIGIKGERGSTDAFFVFNEATDRWTAYFSGDDLATAGTLIGIQASNFYGALVGNADTASKWLTARTITIGTDAAGSASIDGSGDVTINITIANNAVTTAKILDANVTTTKIADSNVTTAKIADANVTSAKLASNLLFSGYFDLSEITVPADPGSDKARFYAKDVAGVTKVAFRDSAGNETVFGTGGSGTPGGSANAIQYNDGAGAFAGEAAFSYDPSTNVMTVDYQTLAGLTPSAPSASQVKLFAKKLGRMLPGFMGPSGSVSALQPHFGRNKIGVWQPPGNATTVPGVTGLTAPTAQGTATARTVATTNAATRMRRLGYVSAASAGSLCGHYHTVAQWTVGDGAGLGGFYMEITFCMSSAVALASGRAFLGMSSLVSAPTNVDPATLTNCFGIGKLSTSNNFHLIYGGSSAQTPIDLGANFPADTLTVDAYSLVLFCPASNSDVMYRLERLNTGDIAEGTITNSGATVLPAASTLLAPRFWRSNTATAQAMGLDIANFYIETDY